MKNLVIKSLLLSACMLIVLVGIGQHSLLLKVRSMSPLPLQEELYVAGNFNNWEPSKTKLSFNASDSSWQVTIDSLLPDEYEFKFTRGNWQKVETNKEGKSIQHRLAILSRDTVVQYNIDAWSDAFPPVEKVHTVSPNVRVMDTAFSMTQLDRNRRIWIYLPPGYNSSKKRYPVLYMQDGQNVFDEFTSAYGEWGVDEWLDSIANTGKSPGIVVAIDNGPKRNNEYNPYDNERFGKGEGASYTAFIVNTLKPYIDRKYRTLPFKENTSIAGSSMGGLISYYAMLQYPQVFGQAGIFSPAFWIAPQIGSLTDSLGYRMKGKMFFYMGELEGETHIKDMQEITEKLGANSGTLIYSQLDPEGRHNEMAWRKWFPQFYKWMMADWSNYIIKPH